MLDNCFAPRIQVRACPREILYVASVCCCLHTGYNKMSVNSVSPLITVKPVKGLIDEKFQIVVEHLNPGQTFTLHSLIHSEDDDFWEAFGHYVSDAKGTVKVSEDQCLGGSYAGFEPMGLLWSMKTVPGSRTGLRLRKKDVCTPVIVRISVYKGHISDGFKEESCLGCAVTERWYMAPGVHRVELRHSGVQGTLFLPPGPGPFPGILDMWGGGGGLVEYRAALLASHGYVSLAVEYLPRGDSTESSPDVLPGKSYFEAAFTLLKDHPQVASDQVALLGLSLGTSIALALAVYSTVVHPKCMVCISGSHVMSANVSIPNFFAEIYKKKHKILTDENNHMIWRNIILPIPTDPNEKLEVGKIKCPLLFIVGGDDQTWATAESAEDIEKMMEQAGNRNLLTVLSYPGAGHLIEPPYSPHIRNSKFLLSQTKTKVIMLWGGETKLHSYAQEDSWQKILKFLEHHLYHSSNIVTLSKL
ncbi:peroxisomal succinyl-coenzyme A thioesterase-like isoform X1 [Lepisosteus oculatus]|uniref:peroxisomal succinyl-coenzyme A thioesterase-like isoform X1 n=1 Tax=Lepisosteus oculatus TaxID=7918 RepID=UPI00371F092A